MTMTKIQKKIADRFMSMTIYWHVKKRIKDKPELIVEEAMSDIKDEATDTLISHGYTIEEIRRMAEEAIKKCQCKKLKG